MTSRIRQNSDSGSLQSFDWRKSLWDQVSYSRLRKLSITKRHHSISEMPDTETSVLLYWETKNKNCLRFKLLVQKKNDDFSVTFVNDLKPSSQIPHLRTPFQKRKCSSPYVLVLVTLLLLFKDFFTQHCIKTLHLTVIHIHKVSIWPPPPPMVVISIVP